MSNSICNASSARAIKETCSLDDCLFTAAGCLFEGSLTMKTTTFDVVGGIAIWQACQRACAEKEGCTNSEFTHNVTSEPMYRIGSGDGKVKNKKLLHRDAVGSDVLSCDRAICRECGACVR